MMIVAFFCQFCNFFVILFRSFVFFPSPPSFLHSPIVLFLLLYRVFLDSVYVFLSLFVIFCVFV